MHTEPRILVLFDFVVVAVCRLYGYVVLVSRVCINPSPVLWASFIGPSSSPARFRGIRCSDRDFQFFTYDFFPSSACISVMTELSGMCGVVNARLCVYFVSVFLQRGSRFVYLNLAQPQPPVLRAIFWRTLYLLQYQRNDLFQNSYARTFQWDDYAFFFLILQLQTLQ